MTVSPAAIVPVRRLPDALAILVLVALWALYFWRILTPNAGDTLSLTEGDFSGQFVAFFGYQVDRLSAGQTPLWNPYNLAGHPFLADTQSAVFYPPRLLTAALVSAGNSPTPGDLYAALQTEMALHVLLGTLLMYAFVRRLAAPPAGESVYPAVFGGLVAALTFGYGGYLSGYPQLQLAILEAGIWLPLILLAIFQTTRMPRPGALCLVLAGVGMGLSLLAGHPQTSLFTLYVALAFLAYRLWIGSGGAWRVWARRLIPAAILFGLVAGGLAAVQLLPGLEYLRYTTRQAMNFDDKGNGFPPYDLIQVVFPGFITLFSPLYFGLVGLALAVWAVMRRTAYSVFFGIAALLALGLSFGAGTVIYDVTYLLVPGASWFRGQERAAFVIAHSISILAGLSMADALAGVSAERAIRRARWGLIGLLIVCGLATAVLFVLWLGPDRAAYEPALRSASFATLLAGLTATILPWLLRRPADLRRALILVALIVFDLFSITMGTPNYDPVPARERLPEPAPIARLRDELLPPGARVDGQRGLGANYGTLYAVPDINGISPLKLSGIVGILDLPEFRRWDLLAVRYVLSDWQQLPVPAAIRESAEDAYGPYNLHELDKPRSFAHLTYGATLVPGDAEAWGLLREPAYDTRQHVILDADPGVDLPGAAPDDPGTAEVLSFAPERIVICAAPTAPAVLTLALPHYPGWQASLDGEEVPILRAYGGLSAVALPGAGTYTLELVYRPWTYRLGAWLSAITLALVGAGAVVGWITTRRTQQRA